MTTKPDEMEAEAISLRTQATEAELEVLGYRDQIKNLESTRDQKAKRTPEHLDRMRTRLAHKEAIAQTLKYLADRADARRAAEQGRAEE